MTRAALALLLAILSAPAFADEAALLISNRAYDTLNDVRRAPDVRAAAEALEDEGVGVVTGRDIGRADIFDRVRAFSQMMPGADRRAVVLSGRFATLDGVPWFLGRDAEGLGLIDVAEDGVPVPLLAELMGGAPGSPSILVLGAPRERDIPAFDLPSGVSLIVTDAAGAMRFAEEVLAEPGASIAGAGDGLRIDGYMTPSLSFLEDDGIRPGRGRGADYAYWLLAERRDELASYRGYLRRFPEGQFAAEARARIDEMTETPAQRAERVEGDMGLTRDGRRQVQRDLSALGYDTRGIDGIFGPGTRSALRGWQNRNGFDVTGFLTPGQLDDLTEQGAERAAELRRADQELWSSFGERKSETELEAYLDRFPDGNFAQEARRRLNDLRPPQETDASRRERQIWRVTQQENTVQGYRVFLEAFPDGAFADDARAAIRRMQGGNSGNADNRTNPDNRDNRDNRDNAANPQAAAAETALGLTPLTRRAVEQRLNQLGHDPGSVDGQFDTRTRQALAQYQSSAGLRATGYVDQSTAVRLLSDTLRDILR